MTDFAAIDFETANQCRSSVCSVGVVIVHDGMIVDRFYSLIQPTPNYYTHWTTEIHGLTHNDTDNAPIFPEVWKQINPLIKGCHLWLIATLLMKDVSALYLKHTRWNTPNILFIVP